MFSQLKKFEIFICFMFFETCSSSTCSVLSTGTGISSKMITSSSEIASYVYYTIYHSMLVYHMLFKIINYNFSNAISTAPTRGFFLNFCGPTAICLMTPKNPIFWDFSLTFLNFLKKKLKKLYYSNHG